MNRSRRWREGHGQGWVEVAKCEDNGCKESGMRGRRSDGAVRARGEGEQERSRKGARGRVGAAGGRVRNGGEKREDGLLICCSYASEESCRDCRNSDAYKREVRQKRDGTDSGLVREAMRVQRRNLERLLYCVWPKNLAGKGRVFVL